jgi:hypothetical protein
LEITLTKVAIWFLWATLFYFLAGCLAFAGLMVRIFTGRHGGKTFEPIRSYIEHALHYCYDKGYIEIADKVSGDFIRFRKYVRDLGVFGLELIVSAASWNEDRQRKFETFCQENYPESSKGERGSPGDGMRVLVDCGWNADNAFRFAREIWTNCSGLTEQASYQLSTEGISESFDTIDRPGRPAPTEKAINARRLRGFRGFLSIVCAASWIILPIETLLSVGAPPEWTVALGTIAAGGSTAGLVYLAIYVISLVALLIANRLDSEPKPKFEGLHRIYVSVCGGSRGSFPSPWWSPG